MSRSDDEQGITNTANDESKTNFNEGQDAGKQAQQDTQNYRNTLGKYIADNPYTKGGEFDTSENQILANTADASSDATRDQLQTQAQRTGQNVNAANATAEEVAQQNERNLSGQSSEATQSRIASKAGYDANGVQMSAEPITAETNLYNAGNTAATGELNTAEQAAAADKKSSFMDNFGSSFASGLGKIGATAATGAAIGLV